jgi:hypothetical protein
LISPGGYEKLVLVQQHQPKENIMYSPTLVPGFIVLALPRYGSIAPITYYKDGVATSTFGTEELARKELPNIATNYRERGEVPTFIIVPCFTPVDP